MPDAWRLLTHHSIIALHIEHSGFIVYYHYTNYTHTHTHTHTQTHTHTHTHIYIYLYIYIHIYLSIYIYLYINIYDSSNINEVIKAVLNFLFFFTIRFYTHKKHQKAQKHNQTKAQIRKQANKN